MERINIEDARIRVEFRKNETNEVVKSEWFDVVSCFCSSDFEHEMNELLKESGSDYYKIVEFEDIPKELQLSDRLPDETIALCNCFCTREDDENFKEAFFYIDDFVEEMFDAQYTDCPLDIKYYIDYSLYQKRLNV